MLGLWLLAGGCGVVSTTTSASDSAANTPVLTKPKHRAENSAEHREETQKTWRKEGRVTRSNLLWNALAASGEMQAAE